MNPAPARIWVAWLTLAAAGVMCFGLALVLAPVLARQGFALLVYADATAIDGFGAEAARYAALAHAVIGALMIGWGTALLLIVRGPYARGEGFGWRVLALSLLAWFVPDTAYSLLSGYWQNAVLNAAFAMLFMVPLAATRALARRN